MIVLALALAIVAIALPDSLNPTLIVADLYMVMGAHPVRRAILFTAAAFTVTLAGGLAIGLGIGDLILSLVPKPTHAVKWVIFGAAGVALVVVGGLLWWRRESIASPPPSREEHSGGGSPLAMGAGIAGVELLTAFPYFAAIALIVGASVSAASRIFLLLLYNVVYVMPLIAIVVIRAVMGERAGTVLTPIGDWIATRWPIVVAPLAATVGVILGVDAILQLT
jgi:hypothetical protein